MKASQYSHNIAPSGPGMGGSAVREACYQRWWIVGVGALMVWMTTLGCLGRHQTVMSYRLVEMESGAC